MLLSLIANPVSTVVFLVALLMIFVNTGTRPADDSVGAMFIRERILGQTPSLRPPPADRVRYLLRDDDIRIVGTEHTSWDQLARYMAERPGDIASITASLSRQRTGLWAPTHLQQSLKLEWQWYGDPWSDPDQERALQVVLKDLAAADPASPWADFAAGPETQERPLWRGHLLNAATLVLLVLLTASLAWLSKLPRWAAALRRRVQTRRAQHRPGHCPACGYNLQGLEEDQCPECGARTTR